MRTFLGINAGAIFYELNESFPADVGTCTWKYKRRDAVTLDPPVPSCDELTQGSPGPSALSTVRPSRLRPE